MNENFRNCRDGNDLDGASFNTPQVPCSGVKSTRHFKTHQKRGGDHGPNQNFAAKKASNI